MDEENKNSEKEIHPNPPLEKEGKIALWKKIVWVVVALIVVVAAVQVVNAAKYKMVVNVKDGQNIMGVNPLADKLDFGDLSRNNGMTRYVSLKSSGSIKTYISVLKFGGISDLVKLDRNNFMLKPGEEAKLAFTIQIPPFSADQAVFRLGNSFSAAENLVTQ